jgi:hypothetical protein
MYIMKDACRSKCTEEWESRWAGVWDRKWLLQIAEKTEMAKCRSEIWSRFLGKDCEHEDHEGESNIYIGPALKQEHVEITRVSPQSSRVRCTHAPIHALSITVDSRFAICAWLSTIARCPIMSSGNPTSWRTYLNYITRKECSDGVWAAMRSTHEPFRYIHIADFGFSQ